MERHRLKTGLQALAGVAALTAAIAAAATAGSATRGSAGTAVDEAIDQSANWAGYVVTSLGSTTTPTRFTSVTATWRQPAAKCVESRAGTSSGIWVGLGGYDTRSDAIEQAGTSADCNADGVASHYAWYEVRPDPPVVVKNLKILPGDTITASVVVEGNRVLFWLKNRTRHTAFSKRLRPVELGLDTAEWIAEAPVECVSTSCGQAPLANFGSVTFNRVAAVADVEGVAQGGTISSPLWRSVPLRLVPDAAQLYYAGASTAVDPMALAGAKPLRLSADGRSFTVTWVPKAKP